MNGIDQLLGLGMSNRKTARTLEIERNSVDRHLAGNRSKGAKIGPALSGETFAKPHDSKGAKRLSIPSCPV